MPEVEFLDLDGAALGPAPARARVAWPRLLPMLLWVAAAAACIVAPFQTFYMIMIRSPDDELSVDGWGRQHFANADPQIHDPRYGIAFVVVAGVLLVAAALWLVPRTRGTSLAVAVSSAAACSLAGGLGVLALFVANVFQDETHVILDSGKQPVVSTGPLFWWAVAAVGLAVAGAVVAGVSRRRARPPVVAGTPPEPLVAHPVAHPEDESLTT